MSARGRRRSWGSVTTKARDKHVLRWVEDTPQGRKRRSKTFHGTYREACLELDRLHVMHADDRPCPTVGKAARMWWLPWLDAQLAAGRVKENTRLRYLASWENDCRPRWDAVPLGSVRPADVQEWLYTLPAASAKVAIVVLRKIADFAVRYEVVEVNKFRVPYDMPSARTRTKSREVLTLAQADAMLEELRGDPMEGAYILAAFGGLRVGEALGAACSSVRLEEFCGVPVAMVEVSRRVDAASGELRDDLKTPQSLRTAAVPGRYGERLAELARERAAEGFGLVTPADDGLPMTVQALDHRWRKRSAVPFSNLRSSWRTYAQYDWGVDYDTLEALMGHRLAGVTGSHYLRPSPEQLAEKVAQAYGRTQLGIF